MKVTFTFDEAAVNQQGHTLDDIYYTIKTLFAKYGLPCVSEDSVLAFEDQGGKHDFAHMWTVIMGLTRSSWFLDSATSCIWHEGEKREDVLRKARLRSQGRKMA